jgi:hypothetical protein
MDKHDIALLEVNREYLNGEIDRLDIQAVAVEYDTHAYGAIMDRMAVLDDAKHVLDLKLTWFSFDDDKHDWHDTV